jgi:hypothetical protein
LRFLKILWLATNVLIARLLFRGLFLLLCAAAGQVGAPVNFPGSATGFGSADGLWFVFV